MKLIDPRTGDPMVVTIELLQLTEVVKRLEHAEGTTQEMYQSVGRARRRADENWKNGCEAMREVALAAFENVDKKLRPADRLATIEAAIRSAPSPSNIPPIEKLPETPS